ncbi:MAG TPA: sortase [Solirubrobacterales bacterium]|nr:sortase [Solirubrobacterales bacterium]
MRRVARIVSVALITAGVVILADVVSTLIWKEPLSAVYAEVRQNQAAGELDTVSDEFLRSPEVADVASGAADTRQRAERLAELFDARLETGEPIGRIRIPAIDSDYVVLQGTEEADLKLGPGHYPDTALPGQGRTVAIAGHRTTYGAPFNQIDKVDVGDQIILEMPYGTFTYEVTATRIVDPDQTGIVRDVGHDRLVLTSCHPLYSAAQRYAVIADLERIDLAGAS